MHQKMVLLAVTHMAINSVAAIASAKARPGLAARNRPKEQHGVSDRWRLDRRR